MMQVKFPLKGTLFPAKNPCVQDDKPCNIESFYKLIGEIKPECHLLQAYHNNLLVHQCYLLNIEMI